jgi:hypothetical protein
MIDAHENLAEAVNEGNAKLESLEASLLAIFPQLTISLGDIAKRNRVTRTQLIRAPWKVPGFGKNCDAKKYPWQCYLSTYLAWISVPEEERRKSYEMMDAKSKKKLRGVAA